MKIKALTGLWCCTKKTCDACPYVSLPNCGEVLAKDAIDIIQYLADTTKHFPITQQGTWVEINDYSDEKGRWYKCSNCGYERPNPDAFCAACGSKNRVGDEETKVQSNN